MGCGGQGGGAGRAAGGAAWKKGAAAPARTRAARRARVGVAAAPGGSLPAPEENPATPATSATPPGIPAGPRAGGAAARRERPRGPPAACARRWSQGRGQRRANPGPPPPSGRCPRGAASPAGRPVVPPPLRFVPGALPPSRGGAPSGRHEPRGGAQRPGRLARRRGRFPRTRFRAAPWSPQPCPGLLCEWVRAPSPAVVGAGGAARGEVPAALIPAPRRRSFQSPGPCPAVAPRVAAGRGEGRRLPRSATGPAAGGGAGGGRCQVSGKVDTLCPKWIIFTENSLGRKEAILPTIDCRLPPSRYGSKIAPGSLS